MSDNDVNTIDHRLAKLVDEGFEKLFIIGVKGNNMRTFIENITPIEALGLIEISKHGILVKNGEGEFSTPLTSM